MQPPVCKSPINEFMSVVPTGLLALFADLVHGLKPVARMSVAPLGLVGLPFRLISHISRLTSIKHPCFWRKAVLVLTHLAAKKWGKLLGLYSSNG
jgi:hypothetical protein